MPSVLGHARATPTTPTGDSIRQHQNDRLSMRAAFSIIGAVSVVLWSVVLWSVIIALLA